MAQARDVPIGVVTSAFVCDDDPVVTYNGFRAVTARRDVLTRAATEVGRRQFLGRHINIRTFSKGWTTPRIAEHSEDFFFIYTIMLSV